VNVGCGGDSVDGGMSSGGLGCWVPTSAPRRFSWGKLGSTRARAAGLKNFPARLRRAGLPKHDPLGAQLFRVQLGVWAERRRQAKSTSHTLSLAQRPWRSDAPQWTIHVFFPREGVRYLVFFADSSPPADVADELR